MEIRIIASGSKGNSYFISDGVTSLLLEAGITLKAIRKGLRFKGSDVAGCLVTHEHRDHSRAVLDLLHEGTDVFMSSGTAKEIGAYGPFLHVQAPGWFGIGTWMICAFPVKHDAAEPFGYVLYSKKTKEKLLFATDCSHIDVTITGLTHIMLEANHCDTIIEDQVKRGSIAEVMANRIRLNHMSLQEAKAFLKRTDITGVHEIILIHLSDSNSDAARFKNEIQALTGCPVIVAGERG